LAILWYCEEKYSRDGPTYPGDPYIRALLAYTVCDAMPVMPEPPESAWATASSQPMGAEYRYNNNLACDLLSIKSRVIDALSMGNLSMTYKGFYRVTVPSRHDPSEDVRDR
jgi:hypothetical protein